jgi:hypothetical protein
VVEGIVGFVVLDCLGENSAALCLNLERERKKMCKIAGFGLAGSRLGVTSTAVVGTPRKLDLRGIMSISVSIIPSAHYIRCQSPYPANWVGLPYPGEYEGCT